MNLAIKLNQRKHASGEISIEIEVNDNDLKELVRVIAKEVARMVVFPERESERK